MFTSFLDHHVVLYTARFRGNAEEMKSIHASIKVVCAFFWPSF